MGEGQQGSYRAGHLTSADQEIPEPLAEGHIQGGAETAIKFCVLGASDSTWGLLLLFFFLTEHNLVLDGANV